MSRKGAGRIVTLAPEVGGARICNPQGVAKSEVTGTVSILGLGGVLRITNPRSVDGRCAPLIGQTLPTSEFGLNTRTRLLPGDKNLALQSRRIAAYERSDVRGPKVPIGPTLKIES